MTALGNLDSSSFSAEKSIIAIRDGSQSALGPLLKYYEKYLLKIANDRLRRDVSVKFAASDLVQETLKDAVQGFGEFRGTNDQQLKAWLKIILLNQIEDASRRFLEAEKRNIKLEISFPGHAGNAQSLLATLETSLTPSQPVLFKEKIQLLSNALSNISEKSRDVIQLHSFEKLTFEQVGKKMGISSEAARKVWIRAVEKLAQELWRSDPYFND